MAAILEFLNKDTYHSKPVGVEIFSHFHHCWPRKWKLSKFIARLPATMFKTEMFQYSKWRARRALRTALVDTRRNCNCLSERNYSFLCRLVFAGLFSTEQEKITINHFLLFPCKVVLFALPSQERLHNKAPGSQTKNPKIKQQIESHPVL